MDHISELGNVTLRFYGTSGNKYPVETSIKNLSFQKRLFDFTRQPVPCWDLHLHALPPLPPLLWLHLPSQHLHCQPKPFRPPTMLRQAGRLSSMHVIFTQFFLCSQLDSQDLRNHPFHHHLSSVLRSTHTWILLLSLFLHLSPQLNSFSEMTFLGLNQSFFVQMLWMGTSQTCSPARTTRRRFALLGSVRNINSLLSAKDGARFKPLGNIREKMLFTQLNGGLQPKWRSWRTKNTNQWWNKQKINDDYESMANCTKLECFWCCSYN